jgi:hypothetical protein
MDSKKEGNRMPFERGKPKTGGRLPGVSNRFTGAFREAVQIVYNRLGGHAAFLEWARDNRTEYYRIASRLIPGEMREDSGDQPIRVLVYAPQPVDVPPALEDHSMEEK